MYQKQPCYNYKTDQCGTCLPCLEQAFLYPWMCSSSLFELDRSQERYSAPSSAYLQEVTFLLCQQVGGVS